MAGFQSSFGERYLIAQGPAYYGVEIYGPLTEEEYNRLREEMRIRGADMEIDATAEEGEECWSLEANDGTVLILTPKSGFDTGWRDKARQAIKDLCNKAGWEVNT